MAPTRALICDPCPVGLPEILSVAHMRVDSGPEGLRAHNRWRSLLDKCKDQFDFIPDSGDPEYVCCTARVTRMWAP